jgi:hypothetical protein
MLAAETAPATARMTAEENFIFAIDESRNAFGGFVEEEQKVYWCTGTKVRNY